MKMLAYCCGPFSEQKRTFCKNFVKNCKKFKLIEIESIRKKITGSIVPKSKSSEMEVIKEAQKRINSVLNSKNNSILINSLMLNRESRLAFLDLIIETQKNKDLKKIGISFLDENLNNCFEKNSKSKYYKEVTFDMLKSQFLAYKNIETKEEADLIIKKIEEDEQKIKLDAQIWDQNKIIYCDSYKKLEEFLQHINSF